MEDRHYFSLEQSAYETKASSMERRGIEATPFGEMVVALMYRWVPWKREEENNNKTE